MAKFEELKGKVLRSIEVGGNDTIDFHAADGSHFRLYHSQDCCESVTIDDVSGDWEDLIGSPITLAEEATSDKNPEGFEKEWQDSFTWTFYKLATVKGYVDIRWYGESNGYYSESVSFQNMDDPSDYGW